MKACDRPTSSGLTLVEILVALGLIAVSLMLVLALIPAGVRAAQRADDVQAAAAWSRGLIESAPVPETFPIPEEVARERFKQKIGPTWFEAERTLSTIPGRAFLYRIEVETTWGEGTRPLKLAVSRYNPAGPKP